MLTTDESENLADQLSEHISSNGWRVISTPTRHPAPKADELKTLIQTEQGRQRTPGKRKPEETDPPEAG